MQSSDNPYPQSYTQTEIRQILEIALSRQIQSPSLTRKQLWELSAELGIDLIAIQEAEKNWLEQKTIKLQKREFNLYRRQELTAKIIRFAFINAIMIMIDWFTIHHLSWSLYLIVIWGLGLGLDCWKTTQTRGDEYEQAFQSWRVRQELKSSLSTIWEKWKQTWQNNNDLEIN